jgi:hypothetical protein
VLSLHKQSGELAAAFLERRLFKLAGRVGIGDAPAQELYDRFGDDARKRSQLERDAESFAGLGGGPKVLIWLPSPTLRMKIADVLVDNGEHIDRFAAYESPRSRRGSDIYGGHSRLWGLWVFTHPAISKQQREEVLAYLAERLGVAWERLRDRWGPDYWQWVDRLILSPLLDADPREPDVDHLVTAVAAGTAARSRIPSYADRQRRLKALQVVTRARERRTSET